MTPVFAVSWRKPTVTCTVQCLVTSVLTHHNAVGTAGELTPNKLCILELIKTNESDLEEKKAPNVFSLV